MMQRDAQEDRYYTCWYCGEVVDEADDVCPFCGANLVPQEPDDTFFEDDRLSFFVYDGFYVALSENEEGVRVAFTDIETGRKRVVHAVPTHDTQAAIAFAREMIDAGIIAGAKQELKKQAQRDFDTCLYYVDGFWYDQNVNGEVKWTRVDVKDDPNVMVDHPPMSAYRYVAAFPGWMSLEDIWTEMNVGGHAGLHLRSMCVGDVIVKDGQPYIAATVGFHKADWFDQRAAHRNSQSLAQRVARIVEKDDGYYVESEKGKNLGGPYKTKAEAEERLRQVEYFKHKDGATVPDDDGTVHYEEDPEDVDPAEDDVLDIKQGFTPWRFGE